jgi:hypothetical protein
MDTFRLVVVTASVVLVLSTGLVLHMKFRGRPVLPDTDLAPRARRLIGWLKVGRLALWIACLILVPSAGQAKHGTAAQHAWVLLLVSATTGIALSSIAIDALRRGWWGGASFTQV